MFTNRSTCRKSVWEWNRPKLTEQSTDNWACLPMLVISRQSSCAYLLWWYHRLATLRETNNTHYVKFKSAKSTANFTCFFCKHLWQKYLGDAEVQQLTPLSKMTSVEWNLAQKELIELNTQQDRVSLSSWSVEQWAAVKVCCSQNKSTDVPRLSTV